MKFKNLNNKQLVDRINSRYSNGLNDDDYIAELCRRREESGNKIAIVIGEEFVITEESEEL